MASVQPGDAPAAAIRRRVGNRGGEPSKRPGISVSSRLRLRGSVLDWTLAALGMLLAGWLRWSGLGRQSLWVDEMSSFGMANTGLRHVIPVVLAFDGHPPLYILVVHFADFVFKLGTVDSVRVPSVLAGIATVGIAYALARLLVGRLAAILCIALVTLSPLLVWYSREGRMYALTWLFVMLSYLALVQAARSGRRIWLVTYGLALALALYSDISAVMALVPQAAVVSYFFLRDQDARSRWLRIAAAYVAGWILFVPWLAVLPRQLPLLHGTFPGYEPSVPTAWHLLADLTGVSAGYASLIPLQLPVVLAVAVLLTFLATIIGAVWLGRSSPLYAAVTLSLTLGPAVMCVLLLLAGSPGVLLPRVMGITAFGLALAVAGSAELAWRAWRPRRLALAAVGAAALVVMTGTAVSLVNVEARGSKGQDWRGVAGLISSRAQPGDALIYYPYGLKIMVDAYLPGGSRWVQDGVGLWHSSDTVVETDFATWADGHAHVWIVFYAATGIDMLRHDAWLRGHEYQRIAGDPAAGAGVLEYVPVSGP
jgi:4-amino-4-deoxy-L-arabinose transferase-like glycosyltransferase